MGLLGHLRSSTNIRQRIYAYGKDECKAQFLMPHVSVKALDCVVEVGEKWKSGKKNARSGA
jgi:hypothetical protein